MQKEKKQQKIDERKRICKYCGKPFLSSRDNHTYCSAECRNRYNNNISSLKKRIKRKTIIRDSGITIERLIKRDGCNCWICGKVTNKADYEIKQNGAFIAGPSYPSIDHVQALSNGGLHTWSNVRLAHKRCNALKGNRLTIEEANGQLLYFLLSTF